VYSVYGEFDARTADLVSEPWSDNEGVVMAARLSIGPWGYSATGAKICHSGDTAEQKLGEIEWMKFKVGIRLPR
jgi:hypothetical protein